MSRTFVIAEAGSSHDNDLSKAYRLIEAAKECGASAVKFQWTSNAGLMAMRRGLGADAIAMYDKYLMKPVEWLHQLKAHADKVGIEWMCTVYLKQDIHVIAPLVKRFKVSAFEAEWKEFLKAHLDYQKQIIISGITYHMAFLMLGEEDYRKAPQIETLHCVSKYPTPVEELGLRNVHDCNEGSQGLSDHTTSTLTGALAVAAGATIIEKHIRLSDTMPNNPDYGHSLVADCKYCEHQECFGWYVRNIREAERAL